MRGSDATTGSMFAYVDLEARVPEKHPLRTIRGVVNDVLAGLDGTFEGMYSDIGRPSIAPEKLLRASLLQAFYTVRSERQLMEQTDYNLLFRWFIGLGIDDPVWNHSTFSKNRDRFLAADVAKRLLAEIVTHAKVRELLSEEHFTVDGTMVQAWASMKSFQPKDDPAKAASSNAGPTAQTAATGDTAVPTPTEPVLTEPAHDDTSTGATATADVSAPDVATSEASVKDATAADAATTEVTPTEVVTTVATAEGATKDTAPHADTTIEITTREISAADATTDAGTPSAPAATATAAPASCAPPKSRNEAVDFHGQKRSNDTHASTTDPDARLFRKGAGKEAKLAYTGHALAENRHGLIVNASLTRATGTAERDAALPMITAWSPGAARLTLGADKNYDTAKFVADCRAANVTPHVAQNNKNRASAIDARTTRHAGYAESQKKRKLIEEAFGWAKSFGGLARPMRRGLDHMAYAFTFAMAAYDLVRLPKLLGSADHGRIASDAAT
jgi:transposase